MPIVSIPVACAKPLGALFREVMIHCRVMRVSLPGATGEMETEIVTSVGSGGATNTAFTPGKTAVIPPLFASQVMAVSGGMKPSSTNDSSSPTSNLQSSGRMVAVVVGATPASDVAVSESDNKAAKMRAALRDINIPGFHE